MKDAPSPRDAVSLAGEEEDGGCEEALFAAGPTLAALRAYRWDRLQRFLIWTALQKKGGVLVTPAFAAAFVDGGAEMAPRDASLVKLPSMVVSAYSEFTDATDAILRTHTNSLVSEDKKAFKLWATVGGLGDTKHPVILDVRDGFVTLCLTSDD